MDSGPASPMVDEDDVPIPCKGCGQVLEEGKAFELAGNRWHIDCFRCNSCETLLDSDANLLLLGDGSLICNSCTYSCTACGNKIEDLAILTGEQAFCAGCFRCRNCKRKIENLKYARTPQGIFCMSCHEALMAARRRKKARPAPQRTPNSSNVGSPMLSLDKSLPSLPVDDERERTAGNNHSTTPTELSPVPRPTPSRTASSPDGLSPIGFSGIDSQLRSSKPTKRLSHFSQFSDVTEVPPPNHVQHDPYSSFIPVVLDNGPAAPLPSISYQKPGTQNSDRNGRDQASTRPDLDRNPSNSSSYNDTPRPHIASQDKTYQPENGVARVSHESDRDRRDRLGSPTEQRGKSYASPSQSDSQSASGRPGDFKLGAVPHDRKKSFGSQKALEGDDTQEISIAFSPPASEAANLTPGSLSRSDYFKSPQARSVSPSAANRKQALSPMNSTSPRSNGISAPSNEVIEATDKLQNLQMSAKSTMASISQPEVSSQGASPLQRPVSIQRPSTAQGSSFSPTHSDSTSENSPALPSLNSPISHIGFDEEIRRVFGGDAMRKRASNSVRHGRSHSDMARGSGLSPKWSLTSPGKPGQKTVLSPDSSSSTPQEENSLLKQELRRSTQKIAELEARLNSTATAKVLESNIQDKRNTVALLETEREAFLRELMVIKERLDASKDGKSIDFDALKSDLIRGLTRELEDLKATLKEDIQALVVQRDQLVEDVENFGRLREQAIQETTQLNLRNVQLADLNNELTQRIQGGFKANKHQVGGLGIYDGNTGAAEFLDIKDEKRPPTGTTSTTISAAGTPREEQPDGTEVFMAQKVAPFKNSAHSKKPFFWKKPGTSIMKGAGKFGRAFASETTDGDMTGADGSGQSQGGTQKGKWGKTPKGQKGAPTKEADGHVPIFGGELEARADYEGVQIPNVVYKCIQEVEMRGMDFEGIYRKSGGATQMREIQQQFERGEDVIFDATLDICSVTSVLKQYFRNLPNPLITYEAYEDFIDITSEADATKRLELLKKCVESLPTVHKVVLQFVIFHLSRVAARREENLMNTRNLAVVFAPTLLRHTSDEREMTDMHAKNSAVQYLIDNNDKIFDI